MESDAMRRLIPILIVAATFAVPSAAFSAETVQYFYDAKGRLIRVVRLGSVNNGVQVTYQHDKADNRKNTTTTGSGNLPPP